GGFCDGRINHAFGAKLREQSFGNFERAAVNADVFAEGDDAGISCNLLEDGLPDSFEHGDGSHGQRLPALSCEARRKALSLGPRPKGTRGAAGSAASVFTGP